MSKQGYIFWSVFAVMMAISSYDNEGSVREYFDALICFMCIIAARLEYVFAKRIDK